jgi:hypothetical protein
MKVRIALVLLLVAAVFFVCYANADLSPNNYPLRMGYMVAAMLASGASWMFFRSARRSKK